MSEFLLQIQACYRSDPRRMILYSALLVVYGLLFLVLYSEPFSYMVKGWSKDDYTYCYFIPFVVLYLIWEKRDRVLWTPSSPSWMGMFPFALGLLLYWLGELGGEFYTLYVSSWLALVGLCWLHLGWSKIREMSFALVLLITLFPLPNFAYANLSVRLQLISSELGTWLVRLAGLSAFRDGNVIDLGFTQLQVVEACNGLRYLIPLMVLGLILAHFYRAKLWKKVVVLLSTIPVAILVNGLRIASTGFAAHKIGPEATQGFLHDFSGWILFMISLGVLLGEMWVLGADRTLPASESSTGQGPGAGRLRGSALEGHQSPKLDEPADPLTDEQVGSCERKKIGPSAWKNAAYGLPALILLGLTWILASSVDFRGQTPAARPFNLFPLELESWQGKRAYLDENVLRSLHLSDYMMIDYQDTRGKAVNFYTAYYSSQSKGESVHTPATCLPGSGWVFERAELINLPGSTNEGLRINRALMRKLNSTMLVYYWFPQRGRVLTNLYELKFFAFWDAITSRRTDGALVRMITPVYEGESIEQSDQRLQTFAVKVIPVLNEFLPGKML